MLHEEFAFPTLALKRLENENIEVTGSSNSKRQFFKNLFYETLRIKNDKSLLETEIIYDTITKNNDGLLRTSISKISSERPHRSCKFFHKWKQYWKEKWNKEDKIRERCEIDNNKNNECDKLPCYDYFKSDKSKMYENFQKNLTNRIIPIVRDDELRNLMPLDAMEPEQVDKWKKILTELPVCLTPNDVDYDNDIGRFVNNSITSSFYKDNMEIINKDEYSLPDLVHDSEEVVVTSMRDSITMTPDYMLSTTKMEKGYESASSRRSSIVDKLISIVKPLPTPDTSPMTDEKSINNTSSTASLHNVIIPTFRSIQKKLDISRIVNNLRTGIISERELASSPKDNLVEQIEFSKQVSSQICDHTNSDDSSCSKRCDESFIEERDISKDSVRFDKYSHLMIYDASKKFQYSKSRDQLSIKMPKHSYRLDDSGYEGDDEVFLKNDGDKIMIDFSQPQYKNYKPILKCKANTKEKLEIQRAEKCDEVKVDEFLKFFEKHENDRHKGEKFLIQERDRQLRNYYSEEYFPEIKDLTEPILGKTEFARNKLATEFNIGRQIASINKNANNCLCHKCTSISDSVISF